MTTTQTYSPTIQTRQGMQPLMRPRDVIYLRHLRQSSRQRQPRPLLQDPPGSWIHHQPEDYSIIIDRSKSKALAEAAKRDPCNHLAANDYGISMPPAMALELIAEIERHRQVNAEGCKPDLNIPTHDQKEIWPEGAQNNQLERISGGTLGEKEH